MEKIAPPSKEEYQRICATQAHRSPIGANVTVVGDGGLPVVLPMVIGNPSGGCKLPPGEKPSPAWANAVAIALRMLPDSADASLDLAQDCVLWPDAATWSAWADRWPSMPEAVLSKVRKRFGAGFELVEEPAFDERPPDAIESCLTQFPRATWRRFTPLGESLSVVIDPASGDTWRFFGEAMRKPGANHLALMTDMAKSTVRQVVKGDGSSIGVPEMFDRWGGLALLVVATLSRLAGAAAEVELGEF